MGVGKSHGAQALGYLACQRSYRVRYAKTPRLLADLGGGRADGTYDARLRSCLGPDPAHPLSSPTGRRVGEGALDRLLNASHHVLMDGPSYRPRKRPGSVTTLTPDPSEEVMPPA